MRIALYPDVQVDPSRRPNATGVTVAVYRPLRTGQQSLWALMLESKSEYCVFHPPRFFGRDVYNGSLLFPWEQIHCGSIPNRDLAHAIGLIEEKMQGPLVPGDNGPDWVTSNLSKLSSSCSLGLDFEVAESLGFKKGERLPILSDGTGSKKKP